MATNTSTISKWFDEGIELKATHMIVVCDTFDYEDYPVYVMPDQDVWLIEKSIGAMQRVMEVYNLSDSKEEQIKAGRVFNY